MKRDSSGRPVGGYVVKPVGDSTPERAVVHSLPDPDPQALRRVAFSGLLLQIRSREQRDDKRILLAAVR
jgi:hypothetical protein